MQASFSKRRKPYMLGGVVLAAMAWITLGVIKHPGGLRVLAEADQQVPELMGDCAGPGIEPGSLFQVPPCRLPAPKSEFVETYGPEQVGVARCQG